MIQARRSVAQARSVMAPGNPVPSWTDAGNWYDERGIETLDRILADRGELASRRAHPSRSAPVPRPERLGTDGRPRSGRLRSAGARRWLLPLAAGCAVAVIATTVAVLGQHASSSGPAQRPGQGRLRILATIRVGGQASGIAVNPATGMAYVSSWSYTGHHGTVSVINTRTNKVTDVITAQRHPTAVAVNPRTDMIYVANQTNAVGLAKAGTISVINGHTDKVTATIYMTDQPGAIAIDQRTNQIYVDAGSEIRQYVGGDNTVSVIDGLTNKVTATIHLGRHQWTPESVAVDPRTDTIYKAGDTITTVSVIDGRAGKVTATVQGQADPVKLAVNARTDTIYVSNQGGGRYNVVSVIDGHTNHAIATIGLGGPRNAYLPGAIAVDPRTNTVYVATEPHTSVTVIDGRTRTVTHKVAIDFIPSALAVNPATGDVYVTGIPVRYLDPAFVYVLGR